jgi:AcrR family transcriptional regulator
MKNNFITNRIFGIFDVVENAYKRKKEPEVNRQLIIDAAIEIGATEDWHQVTFQAIADQTGLSKGGIIHHFKNKEELLEEMMKQGLDELTESVRQYKLDGVPLEKDGSLAYLKFIVSKSDDEHYRKKMRIVLQAIMAYGHYKEMWDRWYQENILPPEGDIDVHGLITMLVADGIWYTENLGYAVLTEKNKQDIIDYLQRKP